MKLSTTDSPLKEGAVFKTQTDDTAFIGTISQHVALERDFAVFRAAFSRVPPGAPILKNIEEQRTLALYRPSNADILPPQVIPDAYVYAPLACVRLNRLRHIYHRATRLFRRNTFNNVGHILVVGGLPAHINLSTPFQTTIYHALTQQFCPQVEHFREMREEIATRVAGRRPL
jgi:hypothetical protein